MASSLNPNLSSTLSSGTSSRSDGADGDRSGASTPVATYQVGDIVASGDYATPPRRSGALVAGAAGSSGSAMSSRLAHSSSVVHSSSITHSSSVQSSVVRMQMDPDFEAQIKRTKAQNDRNIDSLLEQCETLVIHRDQLVVQVFLLPDFFSFLLIPSRHYCILFPS